MNKNVYAENDKMAVEQAFISAFRREIVAIESSHDPIKVRAHRRHIRTLSEAANLVVGAEAGTLLYRIASLSNDISMREFVSRYQKVESPVMEQGQAPVRKREEVKAHEASSKNEAEAGTDCLCGYRAPKNPESGAEAGPSYICGHELLEMKRRQDEAEAGTVVRASAIMRPAFIKITDGGEAGVTIRHWRPSDARPEDGRRAGPIRKRGNW